ncbi:MAG: hypothetical protein FD131_5183 [Rhodocyclaceae bacterium]|nr:MAG: hypothetical protein FD131_5183 [Rhodocyclaceae bacterium]
MRTAEKWRGKWSRLFQNELRMVHEPVAGRSAAFRLLNHAAHDQRLSSLKAALRWSFMEENLNYLVSIRAALWLTLVCSPV